LPFALLWASLASAAAGVIPGTAGYMMAFEAGDGFLCMTWAGRSLVLVEADGSASTLIDTGEEGFESISEPALSGSLIAFAGRGRDSDEILVIDESGRLVDSFGPFRAAGSPSWDASGRLWFPADGGLWMDDSLRIPGVGDVPVEISPSGTGAAGILCEAGMSLIGLGGGGDTILVDRRVISAEWIDDERLLVEDGEGTVWLVRNGSAIDLTRGESPSWSPSANGFFCVRTRDDGHYMISSEIVFSNLSGSTAPVQAPAGTVPVRPAASTAGLTAVDASTGAVLSIPFDRKEAVLTKPDRSSSAGPDRDS
jgi:hypothetical protein